MSSALQPPSPAKESLPKMFGRYVLLAQLSRGGMGEIYLARHGLSGFEKFVVIKKIRPNLVENRGFFERFVDEAQLAVGLQHANIAQVFEVGQVGRELFIALEYVSGRDLRRTFNKLEQIGGRLPVDLALFIARGVATGLAYAHRCQNSEAELLHIVHCDISPPNIMMSFEGEIKIIDFGIARSALQDSSSADKVGWGKFGYISPEQLTPGKRIDHRTDIYSLGVVLYELLTGQRMYPAIEPLDYKELARKVVNGEYPLPSQRDATLAPFDDLIKRAVEPDCEGRYQSAAEFRDDIQRKLVQIHPTILEDNVGLFLRHLFAKERLAARERLRKLDKRSREVESQQQRHKGPKTVTFARGAQFSNTVRDTKPIMKKLHLPTKILAILRIRWLWVGSGIVVLVLALSALLLLLRHEYSSTEVERTRPKPQVIRIEP